MALPLLTVAGVIVLTTLLIYYYIWRRQKLSILARNNIPGPVPSFFHGNIFTDYHEKNVIRFTRYFAKYGPIYGYYTGTKPCVMINDVELARLIQIKDFANFTDRQHSSIKYGIHPNPRFFKSLISAQGTRWKEMRTILNPTFSAAKLKSMTPLMVSCIDIMIEKFETIQKHDKEFDIYQHFQLLTTDVIAKCALGIDTNVQHNVNDPFYIAAKRLFDTRFSYILLFLLFFPEFDSIVYPFRRAAEMVVELSGGSISRTISKLIEKAIDLRKGGKNRSEHTKNDLLQLMLDAKVSQDELRQTNTANLTVDMEKDQTLTNDTVKSTVTNETNGSISNGNTYGLRSSKALTHDEIVSNAILFYEAGYETTSTALGFIAHVLITKPDIQEKIREEVQQLYQTEGRFDYNTVNRLEYMQMVINETMRMYPPVTTFVTRNANEDYHYKHYVIPKGATIRIPAYQLHHDPTLWLDPERFDPERFRDRSAIDPVAFQPFGTGPRNCIGMRFALYEIKLSLAKLLHKYRLVPGPSTEQELTIDYKFITETPKNGVWCKVVPLEV